MTRLNTIVGGRQGAAGPVGWSPLFALVDDTTRVVMQVADWTGGGGTKPATGAYLGPAGLVADIEDATGIPKGDVAGPESSTNGNLPVLSGTTGKLLADSGVSLSALATTNAVDVAIAAAIDALIGGAPGALDTLNELAAALGDNASFATAVTNALALKAPLADAPLTGAPTAPTADPLDESVRIATTAYADRAAVDIRAPYLRRFMKQLYAGMVITGSGPAIARPAMNLVRVLTLGDSVGAFLVQPVEKRLRDSLGDGGRFFSASAFAGGAAAAGSVTDGSYNLTGTYISVPSGGSFEGVFMGGRARCDTIKVYYIKEPGAGTFKVQVNNGSGYADEAGYTEVDADDALGLGIITISKAVAAHSVKLIGLSGMVKFLTPAFLNLTEGGLATFNLAPGGLPVSTMNETPDAIRLALLDDLAPDLCWFSFLDAAEFPGEFTTFMDWYRANVAVPSDFVFIAPSPVEDAPGDALNVANNAIVRDYAAAHGLIYFDGYSIFKDWETLDALGWGGDGTHIDEDARLYGANLLWHWLRLDDLLETPSSRPVKIGANEILSLKGGSLPSKVRFDVPDGGTYPYLQVTYNGFELTYEGSRSISWKDAAGNYAANLGVGQTIGLFTCRFLALTSAVANTPAGSAPALRPLGTANDAGMFSSGVSPGNGSTTAPFGASEIRTGPSSTTLVKRIDSNGIVHLKSYTVATLPTVSPAAQLVSVSDGTGNKRLAVSDGTNWRFPDGNVVS